MYWMSLMPATFRELLPYLSPKALKVVNLKEVAKITVGAGKSWFSKDEFAKEISRLAHELPPGIRLIKEGEAWEPVELNALSKSDREEIGDRVLELYFAQLYRVDSVFIDMRLSRFGWIAGELQWKPAALWVPWEKKFIQSLRKLYLSYYTDNSHSFKEALAELRLVTTRTGPEHEARVVALLLKHFKHAEHEKIRFSVEQFQSSFQELFTLLEEAGIELPAGFAFLGLVLASMYHAMDALGSAHDVTKAFFNVVKKSE